MILRFLPTQKQSVIPPWLFQMCPQPNIFLENPGSTGEEPKNNQRTPGHPERGVGAQGSLFN